MKITDQQINNDGADYMRNTHIITLPLRSAKLDDLKL